MIKNVVSGAQRTWWTRALGYLKEPILTVVSVEKGLAVCSTQNRPKTLWLQARWALERQEDTRRSARRCSRLRVQGLLERNLTVFRRFFEGQRLCFSARGSAQDSLANKPQYFQHPYSRMDINMSITFTERPRIPACSRHATTAQLHSRQISWLRHGARAPREKATSPRKIIVRVYTALETGDWMNHEQNPARGDELIAPCCWRGSTAACWVFGISRTPR